MSTHLALYVQRLPAHGQCSFDEAHKLVHDLLSLHSRRSAALGQDLLSQGLLDVKYAEQRKDKAVVIEEAAGRPI